jgi:hypothetical protein
MSVQMKKRPWIVMRMRRSAISKSSLLASVVVAVIVAVVMTALYLSFLPGTGPATTSDQISILNATLYSGNPSTHSGSSPCLGDALLDIQLFNPFSTPVNIANVVIHGSSSQSNATAFLSISNSCLLVSEVKPTIDPGSSFTLAGYVSVPLQIGAMYSYFVQFDNGQSINQTLLAQAE